jgi:PAS domain S-box-containing protein
MEENSIGAGIIKTFTEQSQSPGRVETAWSLVNLRTMHSKDDTARDAANTGTGTGTGSAGLYGLLVESVLDYAIFALDPDGFVLTWNKGAQRIKGYAPGEIIGRHFSTFYPPEDIEAGKTEMELRVARRDGRFEDQGWRVRKDGTRFWANVIITALRDSTDTLVGFAKVTRDLTERRATEEALRQSEERFRLMVQSVRDYAIFMLDPEGRVATWNQGAQRAKGYTRDEIIGRHFSVFYPPEDIAAGKPAWELEVAMRDGRFEEEGWRLRKDGTPFWASVVITPLRDDAGVHIGFAKVTRDLTERHAAQEKALADARKVAAAEASSQTKSDFLATLSHELRTPLNAVIGFSEIMESGVFGPLGEKYHEYCRDIRESGRYLLDVINDILDMSKIEAGRFELGLEEFELAGVLREALRIITPRAHTKQLQLNVEIDNALVVQADRRGLKQIVLNLLSNAIKFTPEEGKINLRAHRADRVVSIEVEDTGIGIPESAMQHLGRPFEQVQSQFTKSHQGSGLGLAIAKSLTELHGGRMSIRSTQGVGTSVLVELPIRGSQQVAANM